jgi:hypothetical protein
LKSLLCKALIACLGLLLTAAPLAAAAQDGRHWHGPAFRYDRWAHERWERERWEHRRWEQRRAYLAWLHRTRPVVFYPPRPRYFNGYFGISPAGFHAYYFNGAWYPHRRWHNGVFVYFRV